MWLLGYVPYSGPEKDSESGIHTNVLRHIEFQLQFYFRLFAHAHFLIIARRR